MFPKIWENPQIIHFNRVFHFQPSILGYPYFWKHPHKHLHPRKHIKIPHAIVEKKKILFQTPAFLGSGCQFSRASLFRCFYNPKIQKAAAVSCCSKGSRFIHSSIFLNTAHCSTDFSNPKHFGPQNHPLPDPKIELPKQISTRTQPSGRSSCRLTRGGESLDFGFC